MNMSSSLRRWEPAIHTMHYASKAATSRPQPYQSNFFKPLLCRPPFNFSKACVLPKLTMISDLLEDEAWASTNPDLIMDAPPSLAKVDGKIKGANVIKRKIKAKGNGATNEQIMDKPVKALAQGSTSTVNVEKASGYQASLRDWTDSVMQVANNVSNYVEIMQALDQPPREGLGIVKFLKVLVEKILRVQPDVGQLFLLIQGKDIYHVKKRLQDEITQSTLFDNLKSHYGDSYQQFMERKLTPVVGDITTINLGMDASIVEELQRKLDIIVNSAATTTFDERYDHAFNLNTRGAQRVVEFGRSCFHVQLLMHVSTAFVNGERKGVFKEKTFRVGYSIVNEALHQQEDLSPDINVEKEPNIIQWKLQEILSRNQMIGNVQAPLSNESDRKKQFQEALRDLGLERAKGYGWQDTYVFTKAMGEMLVDSTRGKLPVVIVRPSVVESAFKDPFPGWIEGNRMMDPVVISFGKGQFPGFFADPNVVLDVVPVDMVANAMLAAMAKHAGKPGLEVYQVASSVVNPLIISELFRMIVEHFKEQPLVDGDGKPIKISGLQCFQDIDSFINAVMNCCQPMKEKFHSSANADALLKRHNQFLLKTKQKAAYLANIYGPYTFYAGRFDNSNTQLLHSSLSHEESELFGFDVSEIDWDSYIKKTHIPGLRKHVLKGRGSKI